MVTISAKGRVKADGTLDLHMTTDLSETDVEVPLVLEPLVLKHEEGPLRKGGWPDGYFEMTFGILRDNPIAYEQPPQIESREELG